MKSFEDAAREALNKIQQIRNIITEEMDDKATGCVGEIQARTPVKSGDLRRSMTHGKVELMNKTYKIRLGSALLYAQPVEEGHFQAVGKYVPAIGKKLVKSFVPGKHMIADSLTIYQKELETSIQSRIKSEVFR